MEGITKKLNNLASNGEGSQKLHKALYLNLALMQRNGIFIFLIIFLAQLTLPIISFAHSAEGDTTRVELIHANSMRFDRRIGDDVRRLLGEVHFRHEEANMYCDSAYLFSDSNSLRAFSNVYIQVSDTVSIYGDELYYDGNTRIAEMTGNVKMIDPQMTLTTNFLIYDLELNTANYKNGGRIVDTDNDLTSRWGFYYADEKRFFFRDEVVLVNPEYTMYADTLKYNTATEVAYFFGPTTIVGDDNTIFCRNGWYDTRNDLARFSRDAFITTQDQSLTGDTLFYDRNKGYGLAERNIEIRDTVQNILITGHLAEHFEKEGRSVVTQQAMLTVIEQNDSLFLHADTLTSIYNEKTDERWVHAYYKTRFYRKDLQGLADSLVYSFSDSTIYLYHDPVIWTDVHQFTAHRIEVITGEEELKQAHLFDAAYIISEEADVGFNQVKGRRVTGHFRENELWRIDVFGNGETLYYIMEEDRSLVGINKAIASDIVIFVEDRQVSGIRFLTRPEANLYPPGELSAEDKLLRNFNWMDQRRPKRKEDIFIWQ
jgi:lipopolysaccharide export system protein LptA